MIKNLNTNNIKFYKKLKNFMMLRKSRIFYKDKKVLKIIERK